MVATVSEMQKRELCDLGFTKIGGLISQPLVDTAVRALNRSLGTYGARPDIFREYCQELRNAPEITDLVFKSQLWEAVQELVGAGVKLASSQIALRFPRDDDPSGVIDYDAPSERLARMTPHVDGMARRMPKLELGEPQQVTANPGDAIIAHFTLCHGIAENVSSDIRYTIYFRFEHAIRQTIDMSAPKPGEGNVVGFSALVGVQLSPLDAADSGNLVVWPGSHKRFSGYFSEHGDAARAAFRYPELVTDLWREWDGLRAIGASA